MTTDDLSGPGVVHRDGETYLSMARATLYLGKSRATLYRYLRLYHVALYTFPLEGNRVFVKQSDLDDIRNAPPAPKKDDAA
ncbi:MAG TPA: hypothetical protein VF916_12235 [Ktedonobacterales bacterium]